MEFRAKNNQNVFRYSNEFAFLHQFFLEYYVQKWTDLEANEASLTGKIKNF